MNKLKVGLKKKKHLKTITSKLRHYLILLWSEHVNVRERM